MQAVSLFGKINVSMTQPALKMAPCAALYTAQTNVHSRDLQSCSLISHFSLSMHTASRARRADIDPGSAPDLLPGTALSIGLHPHANKLGDG